MLGPNQPNSVTIMKTTLTAPPISLNDATVGWVVERLEGVGARRRINEAIYKVSRHAEARPRCEITTHLVTPGPDPTATTHDHTMAAALAKYLAELEDTLDGREANRAGRHRGHGPSNPPAAFIE